MNLIQENDSLYVDKLNIQNIDFVDGSLTIKTNRIKRVVLHTVTNISRLVCSAPIDHETSIDINGCSISCIEMKDISVIKLNNITDLTYTFIESKKLSSLDTDKSKGSEAQGADILKQVLFKSVSIKRCPSLRTLIFNVDRRIKEVSLQLAASTECSLSQDVKCKVLSLNGKANNESFRYGSDFKFVKVK